MGGAKTLPYDAEVEYITTDQIGPWINTGVLITKMSFVINFTLSFTSVTPRKFPLGVYGQSGDGYIAIANGGRVEGTTPIFYVSDDGVKHGFSISYNNFIIDGVNYGRSRNYFYLHKTHPLCLFTAQVYYAGTLNAIGCRLHGLQVIDGSNFICDLIPVRVGTTGYMYDKVSGALFGNNGTGAFIVGPDK